ncbi:MAG TPA: type II toxin-antitoxin system RelE/ParE family toxin [Thermoanaerobaculia bacterium]|nr:type II toxin-antitoxin system RelE/ParE family toxin [Thermoanaerobaculia bacterium]
MKSRFHEAAAKDLADDIAYYDAATPGLGIQLLVEVRAAVQFLETFPLGAPEHSETMRVKSLVRFPHSLLYVIEENEVVILAVAHQRQDFNAWVEVVKTRRSGA